MPGSLRGLAGVLLLGGCMVGPNAQKLGPGGVPVVLGTTVAEPAPHHRIEGELLAADDSGLVVLSGGRLVRVEYGALTRASMPMSRYRPTKGQPPDAGELSIIRKLSRFPQGIAPALMGRLLVAQNQTTVDVVRR